MYGSSYDKAAHAALAAEAAAGETGCDFDNTASVAAAADALALALALKAMIGS